MFLINLYDSYFGFRVAKLQLFFDICKFNYMFFSRNSLLVPILCQGVQRNHPTKNIVERLWSNTEVVAVWSRCGRH